MSSGFSTRTFGYPPADYLTADDVQNISITVGDGLTSTQNPIVSTASLELETIGAAATQAIPTVTIDVHGRVTDLSPSNLTVNNTVVLNGDAGGSTLTLPASGILVVASDLTDMVTLDDTQTLTNKTIIATSNNVAANSLKSASGVVSVSAATAPTTNQVLTATSATTATWQTPAASGVTSVATGNGLTGGPTNGQLVIGRTGLAPVVAAITGTANQITVTNGAGSIVLSTPQNIATTSAPTFASETLTSTINQLVLGTTRTVTINAAQPAGSFRVYTIPDASGNDSFVMADMVHTMTNKTLTTAVVGSTGTYNGVAQLKVRDATNAAIELYRDDNYPTMQIASYNTHNNSHLLFDAYHQSAAFRASHVDSQYGIRKLSDELKFMCSGTTALGTGITWVDGLKLTTTGLAKFATGIQLLNSGALTYQGATYGINMLSVSGSALTANRTLTFDINNADVTVNLGGNLTTSGTYPLTLTQTGATNVTLPTTGTLATTSDLTDMVTLTGVQTLTNKTIIATSNNVAANSLKYTGGSISTTSSSTPAFGQILTALGSANAVWSNPAVDLTNVATLTNKTLTSPTITGAILSLNDTTSAFNLSLIAASDLTNNRSLTIDVNNNNRVLDMGTNFTTVGDFPITLTSTAITSLTMPTTGTLATLAGVETLSNKTLPSVHIGSTGTYVSTTIARIGGFTNNVAAGPNVEYYNTNDTDPTYPCRADYNFSHNNNIMLFDAYYDGNWRSSHVGTNFSIYKIGSVFKFQSSSGDTVGDVVTWTDAMSISGNGTTAFGTGLTLPSSGGTASTLDHYEEYQYSDTISGAFSGTSTISLVRIGKQVTCTFRAVTDTCGSLDPIYLTTSTMPSRFRPVRNSYWATSMINNNEITGMLRYDHTNTRFFIRPQDSNFTMSALCGLEYDTSVTYLLNA